MSVPAHAVVVRLPAAVRRTAVVSRVVRSALPSNRSGPSGALDPVRTPTGSP
ncbi:hypothetical protein [Actinopolymorpha cephalotaxi]|uniref:hypothetical protein n=1 Tax=Actinopolymorpha cephalotaxi TaxID=504797 RepID=UPI0036322FE1